MFETLTASEQACIREVFGEETTALLARKFLTDEATQAWETDMFSCLSPETGRDLLLDSLLVSMEKEGVEIGAAETACLREVLDEVDPATVVATTEYDSPDATALFGDVWRCLPEQVFELIAPEIGLDLGAVSESELACMQEWVRELDVVALLDAMSEGASAALTELALMELVWGLFPCSPVLLLASFGDLAPELNAEAEACLRELVEDTEASDLIDSSSPEYKRFFAGLVTCVPALLQFTDETDAASAMDDHGNDIETSTAIEVGTTVGGNVDYVGDVDLFRFTAAAGQGYQIDVAHGTLDYSEASLLDSDGWPLTSGYGELGASRIVWEASDSADYYVQVSGWGRTGSYTLTVSLSDFQDDHGNDIETATAIEVGTTVGGIVDHGGDVDLFRFTAEAGQGYQIDVAPGTLEDYRVNLLDSDERMLTSSYGEPGASRIVWAAPDSGDFYVEVLSWGGTGSYTLTISLSDIQDDHGNDIETATAIEVGTTVGGIVDHVSDFDLFRFTAEAGQGYQIDVAHGTFDTPWVSLRDSSGRDLASNYADTRTRASRIVWEASDSADYYVQVSGWGRNTGSYTLTVSLSDIQDDHGDDTDGATAVSVGAATGGVIDYGGDRDFFVFTAQEGQLYQIDVELGTLDDSGVELRDSDGWHLAENDDFGDSRASRIVWRAPESGDVYVVVDAGWGSATDTGSYTMSVTLSTIVDDHGNDTDGATAVSVGATTGGVIDYQEDEDLFRFTAAACQL